MCGTHITNFDTQVQIMPSISRTAALIEAAYKNNDVADARKIFDEYQVSQCYYPKRVLVYDAHTQTQRYITVACGECYHCMESKINEWCTRMYAHAEDFKHVYFVTLTYRGITNIDNDVSRLILQKLSTAIWHKDAYNSTHHMCYNPCLLQKKHYQDFLKRLRKNTGLNDISYVLSGEYGTDYGRPHFHLILFTNGILTKADIVRAWSICLWRSNLGKWTYRTSQKNDGKAYDFPIGRIDFNDLVSNGTFNTAVLIKVDGQVLNAHKCFAYVCKYVCKRISTNLSRVNIAYNNLFSINEFTNIFGTEVPFLLAKKYLLQFCSMHEYQADTIISNIIQNKKTYEKTIFQPSSQIFNYRLAQNQGCPLDEGQKFIHELFFSSLPLPNPVNFPPIRFDFRDKFCCFVEFSRGCPIGSVYATRNLQEFKEGVFNRPLLQTSGFVVPSYFRRKASNSLYGLRICRKKFKSTSCVLGPLVNLFGRFQMSLQNNLPPYEYRNSSHTRKDYISRIREGINIFADVSTGERVLLSDGFARHYKYDRHKRDYINTRNIPVADWIRAWCVALADEFSRHQDKLRVVQENERLRERVLLTLSDFVGEYSTLRNSFVERQNQYLKQRQKEYDELHLSCE